MKRIINNVFLCSVLSAVIATSCTNNEITPAAGDRVAVRISGGVDTRAVNNEWNANDVIGIAMLKEGTDEVIAPYRNAAYTTADGSQDFAPATPDQIMYFPVDGSKVTFKSYYPHNSALDASMVMPLSTTDQSNLPVIDLMTADHVRGTSKDDPNVHLHFYHRLAKVIINLSVEDSEAMSLEGCTLAMTGLKTAGTYDIMNEELKIDEESGKDVSIPISGAHGEGIILPRAAGQGVTFRITTKDGGVYTAIMDSELEIKSGLKHIFNITLKKTPATVSATIEDWGEGPETPIDVVRVVTGLEASSGVTEGDTLRLLMKDEGDADHKYAAKYTYNGSEWTTDTNLYWENIQANPASFIGTTVITPKLNDTQMDDVLVSEPTSAAQYTGINLELKHAAAKTTVTLKSPEGDQGFTQEELAGATVTFPGYKYTGKVNEKGEFVIDEEATHDIIAENTEDGQVAIFPQQTVKEGDVVAVVTIAGREYEIKAKKDITFEPGANNKLDINLSKTEVGVSTKVTDWDDTKAAHEIVFKIDVTSGTTDAFQNGDEIRFYQIGTDKKVVKAETGTCTAGQGSVTFPNAPWDVEDIEEGETISALFPSTPATVNAGEDSFSWTSFDTGKGMSNDDLLIATHTFDTTPGPNDHTIDLTFKHVLSKVTVNIIAGEGFTAGDFADHSVDLNNLILTGDVNVATGTATPVGVATASFTPEKITTAANPANTVATYEALIIPQEVAKENTLVTVYFGGKDYPVNVTKDIGITTDTMSFVAGSNHTINVTFKKTGISLSATVAGWEDGKGGDITIQ